MTSLGEDVQIKSPKEFAKLSVRPTISCDAGAHSTNPTSLRGVLSSYIALALYLQCDQSAEETKVQNIVISPIPCPSS